MSKDLYLLRHAKSSWEAAHASDRERGLNNRGQRNAPQMGRELAKLVPPMLIRVSPARRAQLTLAGLQDGWPELAAPGHHTDEALYTFAASDLIAYIQDQPATETALFLLGHNPALTDLINWICGAVVLANLPTAGFAHLVLAIDEWSALDGGCGRLCRRILPRELDKN
jgi:phosphohistidine phosphatase